MRKAFSALLFALVVLAQDHAIADTIDTPYSPYDAYSVGAVINQTAATVTSSSIKMRSLLGMSVQIDHGNIVGSLALWASNDDVTYYATQGVTFGTISGSGGEIVELGNLRSLYYRFVYTHTSGTGTIKVTPFVKGKNL